MANIDNWSPKDLPGNSYKERDARKRRKEITPVTKGDVKVQKQTIAEKISSTFLKEDIKTVIQTVFYDVLLPAAKDTLSRSARGFVDGLLYGKESSDRIYRDRGTSRVYRQYDNYYDSPPWSSKRNDDAKYSKPEPPINNLLFSSRDDAEAVLTNAIEYIEEYDCITVRELYAYANRQTDYTKEKYGWYNLKGATVDRVRDGYLLKLPRPVILD